jgi:hypothetical protein
LCGTCADIRVRVPTSRLSTSSLRRPPPSNAPTTCSTPSRCRQRPAGRLRPICLNLRRTSSSRRRELQVRPRCSPSEHYCSVVAEHRAVRRPTPAASILPRFANRRTVSNVFRDLPPAIPADRRGPRSRPATATRPSRRPGVLRERRPESLEQVKPGQKARVDGVEAIGRVIAGLIASAGTDEALDRA